MRVDNRGMALVSVVLILASLMVLSLMLAEKVWYAARTTAALGLRAKTLWAANAGVETARHALAATYQSSQGWRSYLQTTTAGYPAQPVWRLALEQIQVEVFVRDNHDGDNDPQQDNDLQLFVLARARSRHGPEILVEACCGLEPGVASASSVSGASGAGSSSRLTDLMTAEADRDSDE